MSRAVSPVAAARRLAAAFALTAGCAAAPPPAPAPPPPPPERPALSQDGTYFAVTFAGEDARLGLGTFCDVTQTNRYRLRYNRLGWPTCSARELYVGASDPSTSARRAPGMRWTLADGRRVEIWPAVNVGAQAGQRILPGAYALAALSPSAGTIEALTGALAVYDVRPGQIHYLGEVDGGRPIRRDADAFAAAFAATFPEIPRARLNVRPAATLTVECEPFTRLGHAEVLGLNCVGRRTPGDPLRAPGA